MMRLPMGEGCVMASARFYLAILGLCPFIAGQAFA